MNTLSTNVVIIISTVVATQLVVIIIKNILSYRVLKKAEKIANQQIKESEERIKSILHEMDNSKRDLVESMRQVEKLASEGESDDSSQ